MSSRELLKRALDELLGQENGASDSKLPDYLVDEIQIKIEALRKIVLEGK